MPTTPPGPGRDQRNHWRNQHDDLQALTAEVRRIADYNARLVEMIERFLLSLPAPTPSPPLVVESAPPSESPNDLLTIQEAAERLNVGVSTLYAWRNRRIGPDALKAGRHLRYQREAIDQWVANRVAQDRLNPPRESPRSTTGHSTRHGEPWSEKCPAGDTAPYRLSRHPGRGICGTCEADLDLKRNGRLPVHRRR